MVTQLTLAKLQASSLEPYVKLIEHGMGDYAWLNPASTELVTKQQEQLADLQGRLVRDRTLLMNEATIWARAIYPLLLLAERDDIQAWVEVEVKGEYPNFTVSGVADGVLARCIEGELKTPYLIVVEAKRGLEAENPKYQLYGQLLAIAYMNWKSTALDPQEVFGCYTIADTWTFVRAEVEGMESDRPTLTLESSRDYVEKLEATQILQILQGIVSRYTDHSGKG
ncbi:MAG: hypothetical protein F6J87_12085 [Spirulina sp. SIO3F2]|nr:hypothetical protein [Spirulina sp. SIO3F2]